MPYTDYSKRAASAKSNTRETATGGTSHTNTGEDPASRIIRSSGNSTRTTGTEGNPVVAPTARIISAYIAANAVSHGELRDLIDDVSKALAQSRSRLIKNPKPRPCVPVSESVTSDYIVCLEDGRKLKSLKRHLRVRYGLTPDEYRDKWDLPISYPMVAPSYTKLRSTLAHSMRLGHKRK